MLRAHKLRSSSLAAVELLQQRFSTENILLVLKMLSFLVFKEEDKAIDVLREGFLLNNICVSFDMFSKV